MVGSDATRSFRKGGGRVRSGISASAGNVAEDVAPVVAGEMWDGSGIVRAA